MDRVNGANFIDIGGGRRGFRSQNKGAGIAGTEVTALFLNQAQEEVLKVIEEAGLVANPADDTQLYQALQVHIASMNITVDTTLTIGSDPADDFATIPEAMTWLRARRILTDAIVSLALRAERHVYDATDILIDHEDASRIHLLGAAMLDDDPVEGDFAVTGYSSGQRAADAATNLIMLRTKYATELRLVNGSRFDVIGAGLGFIDDILITGNGAADVYGMTVEAFICNFGTVSLHGFGDDNLAIFAGEIGVDGVVTSSGSVAGDGIELSDCIINRIARRLRNSSGGGGGPTAVLIGMGNAGHGVEYGRSVQAFIDKSICKGNGGYGTQIARASYAAITTLECIQNGQGTSVLSSSLLEAGPTSKFNSNGAVGLIISEGSVGLAPSAQVNSNGTNGVRATGHSYAALTGGQANNNGNDGVSTGIGSTVLALTHTATGNGGAAYSPAINTVGNQNSYIQK